MNCDQLRDHYELYAMGVADEPELSEIREHLNRGCEVCMAGVKKSTELTALLGASAAQASPSGALRRRILASIGVEPRRFAWSYVWAAAAVLALFVAASLEYQATRAERLAAQWQGELLRQARDLDRLNEALAILSARDTRVASFGNGPSGKILVNPSRGVVLLATNLPLAPAGKRYEMWIVPKSGKPVAAGLFQSQPDGTALHVRPGSVDLSTTAAVAVTLEDEQGADQPTSQPLIAAPLSGS